MVNNSRMLCCYYWELLTYCYEYKLSILVACNDIRELHLP